MLTTSYGVDLGQKSHFHRQEVVVVDCIIIILFVCWTCYRLSTAMFLGHQRGRPLLFNGVEGGIQFDDGAHETQEGVASVLYGSFSLPQLVAYRQSWRAWVVVADG